ncbi:MAG: thioredoxin family protein [Gemmatimonadota bacterium]|nr:MAG: thioredoxin family protein [Gemmatimonadota bacterium]
MTTAGASDFNEVWRSALPYVDFVAKAEENRPLWEGVYRTTPIPDWALERACECGRGLRLLAIVEDWCGDASNTVPVLAKLGDLAECLEVRVIERDKNPAVMDRYLTSGSRAIPIVIVLDAGLKELGHWGPRPVELQQWVMEHKDSMSKEERYWRVRRWYAKDKGVSTLSELLQLIEGTMEGG